MEELSELTNAEVMRRLHAVTPAQWLEISVAHSAALGAQRDAEDAAMRVWQLLEGARLVPVFPWLEWLEDGGEDIVSNIERASIADVVRLAIVWTRHERHNLGSHVDSYAHSPISPMAACVSRLLEWSKSTRGGLTAVDTENVRLIFKACRELTESTGRPFSIDGHLVGSLGEVLAADMLKLRLMPPSTEGYDALDLNDQKVEIKTTTVNAVALSAATPIADLLVVVSLDSDGAATIVYHDRYLPAWNASGKRQKTGQRRLSLSKLHSLTNDSPPTSGFGRSPD